MHFPPGLVPCEVVSHFDPMKTFRNSLKCGNCERVLAALGAAFGAALRIKKSLDRGRVCGH